MLLKVAGAVLLTFAVSVVIAAVVWHALNKEPENETADNTW